MTKYCPDCEKNLPRQNFAINAKNGDGLYSYCRGCTAIRKKAYRTDHPEIDKARAAAWYAENKAKSNEISRQYHQKNREARVQKIREYYYSNQEQMQSRTRAMTQAAPDYYVRHLIVASMPWLPREKITSDLIDAKRAHLKVCRILKESRK
jgi:hypothetical protein